MHSIQLIFFGFHLVFSALLDTVNHSHLFETLFPLVVNSSVSCNWLLYLSHIGVSQNILFSFLFSIIDTLCLIFHHLAFFPRNFVHVELLSVFLHAKLFPKAFTPFPIYLKLFLSFFVTLSMTVYAGTVI